MKLYWLSSRVIALGLSREYIECMLLVDFTINSYMLSGIYTILYYTVPTTNRLIYGFNYNISDLNYVYSIVYTYYLSYL